MNPDTLEFLHHSWTRCWQDLQLPAPSPELEQRLVAAWSESQRHYHSLQHLAECLALFEAFRPLAEHPGEVGLALWFHDAVYDVKADDNELRSAQWAHEALQAQGASAEQLQRVDALIMATCHLASETVQDEGPDAALLLDIDLSILGADPARFAEYEQQVRSEYAWVPSFFYGLKRREILQRFARRERIYQTPALHQLLEERARANLAGAMA